MTRRAGGTRRVIPRAWVLPFLALVGVAVAAYFELVSRSIAHDFAAWWPVWLLMIGLLWLARGRRWRRVRVSAVVAIVWVAVVGVFVTGHVQGWAVMPSASTYLNGPQAGSVATAALSARIDGRLEVGSGESGFLYAVDPLRRGGPIGPPVAQEQLQGANLSVALSPSEDPGLYTFSGWVIDLDEAPAWSLALGGEVTGDLTRLRLTSLQLDGSGEVLLGSVSGEVVVTVSGDFDLVVPPGVPARVVGEAVVPEGWTTEGAGYAAPTPGQGWVISVGEGASLSIAERQDDRS